MKRRHHAMAEGRFRGSFSVESALRRGVRFYSVTGMSVMLVAVGPARNGVVTPASQSAC